MEEYICHKRVKAARIIEVDGQHGSCYEVFLRLEGCDSFIDKRIQTDTPSRKTETRKGMRQPHSAKASSPIALRVARITIRDRNRPSVAVV